jgi:hypothetical protein
MYSYQHFIVPRNWFFYLFELKTIRWSVFCVYNRDPIARRFYERYGFVVIGDRSFAVVSGAETSLDLISNDLCRIVDYC